MSAVQDESADAAKTAAQALGQELKQLRLQHSTSSGRPLTQEQMAKLVLVGGKGVVSQFESGKRLPDVDALKRYALVAKADSDRLVAMRQAARDAQQLDSLVSSRAEAIEQGAEAQPLASGLVVRFLRGHHGVTALAVAGGIVVLAVVAITYLAATFTGTQSSSQDRARITYPTGTVGQTTPIDGTVTGFAGDDLWLNVQSTGEKRFHPTNTPCIRHGDKFTFNPIYVGRPQDRGVTFRITVLATTRGGNGDAALYKYGRRSKTAEDAYAGLVTLPEGVRTVDTIFVTRD